MLDEIRVGVEHICSLLAGTPSSKAVDGFCSVLQERLELRYAANWFPRDGERGSASRALTWHAHGGGEGLDRDVLAACRALLDTGSVSSNAFQPSTAAATAAASALFTMPFTLWIDPGCVAVRHGYGPGTYMEGAPSQPQGHVVLFGSVSTARDLKHSEQAYAVASSRMQPLPTLALLPSTPALGSNDATQCPPTTDSVATSQHFRAPSWASSTTSQYRSSSPTSRSSSLTTGSSSACPSLVAASSTHCDSDSEFCEEGEDDDENASQLSIQDMMDRGGFKNFDIIDDDDDVADQVLEKALERRMECIEDDATIGSNDGETTTVGLFGLPGDQTVQTADNEKPSTTAITSYDGGNVGVLGGGVRLGASRASAQPVVKAKHAWHPSQVWENTNGNGKLPFDSTPTAGLSLPYAKAWSNGGSSPALSLSALSCGGGHFPGSLPSPTTASPYLSSVSGDAHEQQYVMIDGYAVPIPKRGRMRGRRSRGRGAGRAARRQAAAAAAAAAQDGLEMEKSWSDDGDMTAPTLVMPSALGISMNSGNGGKSQHEPDADARLMAIVRQRADQVAKDVVRRHLMEQQQRQQQQQRTKSMDRSLASTPRMTSHSTSNGHHSSAFAALPPMPVAAVAHQQHYQQQFNLSRPSYMPPHMNAHMHQSVPYSPRLNAMHGGLY